MKRTFVAAFASVALLVNAQETDANGPATQATNGPLAGAQGSAGDVQAYVQDIAQRLGQDQQLPPGLADLGLSSTVDVGFKLAPDGKLVNERISKSGGIPAFDQLALNVVARASFAPFNADMPNKPLNFTVPITFSPNSPRSLALDPSTNKVPLGLDQEALALKEYFPAEFAKLDFQTTGQTKTAPLKTQEDVLVIKIINAHLAYVNDANAKKWLMFKIDDLRDLEQKDPKFCVDAEQHRPSGVSQNALLSSDLIEASRAISTAMIIQIATMPSETAEPLSPDQVDAFLAPAFETLPQNEQLLDIHLVLNKVAPTIEAEDKSMCDLFLAVYSLMLKGPPKIAKSLLVTGP